MPKTYDLKCFSSKNIILGLLPVRFKKGRSLNCDGLVDVNIRRLTRSWIGVPCQWLEANIHELKETFTNNHFRSAKFQTHNMSLVMRKPAFLHMRKQRRRSATR